MKIVLGKLNDELLINLRSGLEHSARRWMQQSPTPMAPTSCSPVVERGVRLGVSVSFAGQGHGE